jgi:hypothetical protein
MYTFYVRFDVLMAITMKNAVFWDIKIHVRFEVFTAVTMKNGVFWDIKIQFLPHRRHIV